MKTCSRCRVAKPWDDFNRRSRSKDNKRSECKTCTRASRKVYYQENKERCKRNSLVQHYQSSYGLSLEEVEDKLDGGTCEICGRICKLVVDHSHATGKVRGFICRQCNCAIGLVYEDTRTLTKIINYLGRNKA